MTGSIKTVCFIYRQAQFNNNVIYDYIKGHTYIILASLYISIIIITIVIISISFHHILCNNSNAWRHVVSLI